MQRRKAHYFLLVSTGGLLAAVAGSILALVLCRFIVLESVQAQLAVHAHQLLGVGEDTGGEIARTLRAINASPDPFCSDAQIDLLRGLVFRSRQIKEAGRIRDGALVCSNTLGRLEAPLRMPPTTMQTRDSMQVYTGIRMPFSPQDRVTVLQAGEAGVVVSDAVYSGMVPPPFRYTVVIVNALDGKISRNWGEPLTLSPATVLAPGAKRIDGMLYYSVCSIQSPICAITDISLVDVWKSRDPLRWIAGVAGGALGLLAGTLAMALWRREQPLEARLRRAIHKGALTVAYQPIVDLESGRTVGAEALVRWRTEQGLPISAEVFVKLAEDKGFIDQITRFVLRDGLDQLGELLRKRPDFRLNINIAPSDITDTWLFDELEQRIAEAGVSPAQIGLELTERSATDRTVAIDAIARLRKQGHVVYIDDFGTGYSSLSYLTELNVNSLKIDRAFTRTVRTDAVTASIVPQIVEMARTLGMGIVVEGIETPAQYEYFRTLGNGIRGQGRYFAHPMMVRDFLAWLSMQDAALQDA